MQSGQGVAPASTRDEDEDDDDTFSLLRAMAIKCRDVLRMTVPYFLNNRDLFTVSMACRAVWLCLEPVIHRRVPFILERRHLKHDYEHRRKLLFDAMGKYWKVEMRGIITQELLDACRETRSLVLRMETRGVHLTDDNVVSDDLTIHRLTHIWECSGFAPARDACMDLASLTIPESVTYLVTNARNIVARRLPRQLRHVQVFSLEVSSQLTREDWPPGLVSLSVERANLELLNLDSLPRSLRMLEIYATHDRKMETALKWYMKNIKPAKERGIALKIGGPRGKMLSDAELGYLESKATY